MYTLKNMPWGSLERKEFLQKLVQEQNRRILGSSLANQMLLFNHKLTAEQAATSGFVSEVHTVA